MRDVEKVKGSIKIEKEEGGGGRMRKCEEGKIKYEMMKHGTLTPSRPQGYSNYYVYT